MSIQEEYNIWSISYDTDKNLTRDLDEIVTKENFEKLHFKTILEFGCGTGKNTKLFSQISENVIAVDFSEGMINKAKEKIQANNVKFLTADITKKWPDEIQSAELITCNLILEHVYDLNFIFSEASRKLLSGGKIYVSELHPFRQYQGKKARFEKEGKTIHINSYVHNISDFINAASTNNLKLLAINEWWHKEDENKLPRLITIIFEK
jgi:malonyl-CoA O-methyltransferase